MKTKWIWIVMATIGLGFAALGVTGCKKSANDEGSAPAHQYTCPMHPEVQQGTPGDCRKCGMKLVEKK